MAEEMSEEFYYPDELVLDSLEWENASHRPGEGGQEVRDAELQEFIEQQANKNTTKKTQSDMRVWEHYCQQKGEKRSIEAIPMGELDRISSRTL